MKKLGSFLAGAAVVIAVACGGSTRDSDSNNSGASSGSAGRGGSGTLGSGGGGMDGSGGSSGRGGSLGEAGSGGSPDAGPPPTDCNAPPESYSCEGGDRSFYFDKTNGVCKAYGSFRCSYQSANRFRSLAECLSTCPNARPDATACDRVFDCAVVDTGCCAACEPAARDSLTAVNYTRIDDFKPPCPPIACGPCPNEDELATARQYFVPTCYAGVCDLFDIRYSGYTECTVDSDCTLRDGALCCEGCDGKGLVSLSEEPIFPICEGDYGCPDCASNIPPEFAPKCQEGHCRVTRRSVP